MTFFFVIVGVGLFMVCFSLSTAIDVWTERVKMQNQKQDVKVDLIGAIREWARSEKK